MCIFYLFDFNCIATAHFSVCILFELIYAARNVILFTACRACGSKCETETNASTVLLKNQYIYKHKYQQQLIYVWGGVTRRSRHNVYLKLIFMVDSAARDARWMAASIRKITAKRAAELSNIIN